MALDPKQDLLKRIPSMTELLKAPAVVQWVQAHSQALVTDCLRRAVAHIREEALAARGESGKSKDGAMEAVVAHATALLAKATSPHLRDAINATGVILHTGLGRAVFPAQVALSQRRAQLSG